MDNDDRVEWNLRKYYDLYIQDPAKVPCSEADAELLEAEGNPEALTNAQINQILDPIIDALAANPDAISKASVLDTLQCLLKYYSAIPVQAAGKVLDIIVSGLSTEADSLNQDIEAEEQESIKEHRELIEIYSFLLVWVLACLEMRTADKPGTGKKTKPKGKGKGGGHWDATAQMQSALEVTCKVLKLRLMRVFPTTPERDKIVELLTRPAYLIMENEQRVKTMKMHVFKVLCIAVKHQGHALAAQTKIVQSLTYFEHLSEPMAEFLQILSEQYDHHQLIDDLLRELSNKEFGVNDLKGPKSVSVFITQLSQRVPRQVIRQMTSLIKLLEKEPYTLRNAVIEVAGNMVVELANDPEKDEAKKLQISAFFELLEERFLDLNPYSRAKTMQVYHSRLLDLPKTYPRHRQKATDLAFQALNDKSSHVRRNAIRLLTKLINTHPFGALHGGTLKRAEWIQRLEAVDHELTRLLSAMEEMAKKAAGNDTVDPELLEDATVLPDASDNEEEGEKEGRPAEQPEAAALQAQADNQVEIDRLQITKKYYAEAVRFINTIHSASGVVTQLLSAKNKSEIIEAMDFFKTLDVHKVETAKIGVRRMLRLIWTKGNSDEGKGVQAHLIETYKDLFFNAPDGFSENERANYIARNMISLTYDTTAAELTSLEQLLSKMMTEGHVSDLVVTKLWMIYGVQKKDISRKQRRGAIIVLGMLALAEPDIVIKELETLLRVGLGPLGRADLGLAKYTCLALRHISPAGRKAKDTPPPMGKLPNVHPIMVKISQLLGYKSDSKDWFGVAEQAIGAIYALAKNPDELCSEIIRRKAKSVFEDQHIPPPPDPLEDQIMHEAGLAEDLAEVPQEPSAPPADASFFPLSQLLFIVGHVAIKQIVHLELLEQEFKRKKAELEKTKDATTPNKKGEDQDEMDLIGGTNEDDFTEGIANIRENELLYGPNSLLSNFGPLVAEICQQNTVYHDRNLQAQATLCMGKLMCVSSQYCEDNLGLLITIMERSTDPITRSNAVIALGDMAVCFNHLIDENTNYLYGRLNDNEASVKRTCLMTLTFLILAGQVKVKGQLGQMAKCLEDSDKRISDLARMFFTELATKDNAVYNYFVDMFGLLSAERDLDEDAMKRIIKFLSTFIEKDKHAKQLADKLAARLPRCETERQWNDVVYALSQLQHKNEEIQKTIQAGFRVVQANAA